VTELLIGVLSSVAFALQQTKTRQDSRISQSVQVSPPCRWAGGGENMVYPCRWRHANNYRHSACHGQPAPCSALRCRELLTLPVADVHVGSMCKHPPSRRYGCEAARSMSASVTQRTTQTQRFTYQQHPSRATAGDRFSQNKIKKYRNRYC